MTKFILRAGCSRYKWKLNYPLKNSFQSVNLTQKKFFRINKKKILSTGLLRNVACSRHRSSARTAGTDYIEYFQWWCSPTNTSGNVILMLLQNTPIKHFLSLFPVSQFDVKDDSQVVRRGSGATPQGHQFSNLMALRLEFLEKYVWFLSAVF